MSGELHGLDDAQRAQLRERLTLAEAALTTGLSEVTEAAQPVDLGLAIGRLSRVDAMQPQQLARARKERVGVQLQQLRSALARLDAGTYGACLRCDEPIGLARLEARPEATLCRTCQLGDE